MQVYRNIVADLFDPYLTLLVACYQFLAGSFTNIADANFGQGERNKVEYLQSRLDKIDPDRRLLSGYEGIVRNAVSHSGSHGIEYLPNAVLFRNIKRGQSPQVETVQWNIDSLLDKVTQLYECIISIDAAVNVFGIDCQEILTSDWSIRAELIQHAFSPEDRAAVRAKGEEELAQIREAQSLSLHERLDPLSKILFYNCAVRDMEIRSVKADSSRQLVLLDLPGMETDLSDDEFLLEAVVRFCRYGIIARSIFGPMFETYAIRALKEAGPGNLTVILKGFLLDEYGNERAGLVDLIDDAEVLVDGERVGIKMNFELIVQKEKENLGQAFPRKPRPSNPA